ncbi:MAG: hypothetical protein IKO19_06635 [Candidatus Riflebacteria bacterium]|nr:hypothetical protein [Candidatus Riflebacteria bacterium]MBR4570329.1 hypothetical protein [Candidatus Riflebacteria bacterium]
MTVFNCQNSGLEIIVKPIDIRDHLCGRLVKYQVFFKFSNGTALLLPELFDDGKLQNFFFGIPIDKNGKNKLKYSYDNLFFSYLNEPLYCINLNCFFKNKTVIQPTLFGEDSFEVFQPTLFGNDETDTDSFVEIELIIKKHFKENCYWEDFIDYVMVQQNLAKIIKNKTDFILNISINNGCLDDFLLANESIEKEMIVNSSIKVKIKIEDFQNSIAQLKEELNSITPVVSTIIDSNVPGQKCFDLGPEAKPLIDNRRLQRLNDLKLQLEKIFSLEKESRKTELFGISAKIEYLLLEELRKTLKRIFDRYSDREAFFKAVQVASEEIYEALQITESDENIIKSILNSEPVSSAFSRIILEAGSAKSILNLFDKINEENSLKKLFKLFN